MGKITSVVDRPYYQQIIGLICLGFMTLGVFSCGERGTPRPGFTDPCDTAMNGVLDCPIIEPVSDSEYSIPLACHKLVNCGILAFSYLRAEGQSCPATPCDESRGGECLEASQDQKRCHYPYLDYRWCVQRLNYPQSPCGHGPNVNVQNVAEAVRCIMETQCLSLGAEFSDKLSANHSAADLDKHQCPADNNPHWTATTCDFGLLNY